MSMDLVSESGEQHFNNTAWRLLTEMALQYGWEPAGAREPDPEDDESEDGDFVELSREQVEACGGEVIEGPLAQALASLCLPSGGPVLNSYFHNAGFRVTAEDARALADAVERALPDVPNHDALDHKCVDLPGRPGRPGGPGRPGMRVLPSGVPVSPYESFSGKNKRRLTDFIAFCRQGGFEIR